jgi:hypothetical protein
MPETRKMPGSHRRRGTSIETGRDTRRKTKGPLATASLPGLLP